MISKKKSYSKRRRPYTVYKNEYNKLASKYDMKYDLMDRKTFATAYSYAKGMKNISKTLASKSLYINKKQAVMISKAQTELTGEKITWKDAMSNAKVFTNEQWKEIQNLLSSWS